MHDVDTSHRERMNSRQETFTKTEKLTPLSTGWNGRNTIHGSTIHTSSYGEGRRDLLGNGEKEIDEKLSACGV